MTIPFTFEDKYNRFDASDQRMAPIGTSWYIEGRGIAALHQKGLFALKSHQYHFVLLTQKGLVQIYDPRELKADMLAKGFFVSNRFNINSTQKIHSYTIQREFGCGGGANKTAREAFDALFANQRQNNKPVFATLDIEAFRPHQQMIARL